MSRENDRVKRGSRKNVPGQLGEADKHSAADKKKSVSRRNGLFALRLGLEPRTL